MRYAYMRSDLTRNWLQVHIWFCLDCKSSHKMQFLWIGCNSDFSGLRSQSGCSRRPYQISQQYQSHGDGPVASERLNRIYAATRKMVQAGWWNTRAVWSLANNNVSKIGFAYAKVLNKTSVENWESSLLCIFCVCAQLIKRVLKATYSCTSIWWSG